MTTSSAPGTRPGLRELPTRLAAFAVGTGLVWVGVALLAQRLPVDLTAVLLVLLAVVMALAVLTGPVLGVVTAVVTVVLVNWYLVAPYGTFEVASPENVVALVVFPLAAGVTAVLMELAARARARAASTASQAALVARMSEDTSGSLERLRRALDLDSVSLTRSSPQGPDVVAIAGTTAAESGVVLDAAGPDGYRLVGTGVPRMAEDPVFLTSLAAAAVRAYESDQLVTEARRADELAAVDRARSALLASVGHDLRTPLASLRLAVDTLRAPDIALDGSERRELLDTVDVATSRLDELISNLLDLSRIEAGTLLVHAEPVALDGVVAAAVVGREYGTVDVQVDDNLPFVLVDPMLLERVLENLVSNAVRHGGAVPGRPLTVSATPRTSAVVVDVIDHGAGLTAPRPPADGGTGLGLEIVRGFCDAMAVPLEFHDTHGGGLTVRLTLPLARGGAG